jgi:hypothetical protein
MTPCPPPSPSSAYRLQSGKALRRLPLALLVGWAVAESALAVVVGWRTVAYPAPKEDERTYRCFYAALFALVMFGGGVGAALGNVPSLH